MLKLKHYYKGGPVCGVMDGDASSLMHHMHSWTGLILLVALISWVRLVCRLSSFGSGWFVFCLLGPVGFVVSRLLRPVVCSRFSSLGSGG
jgi:hypothetical protein